MTDACLTMRADDEVFDLPACDRKPNNSPTNRSFLIGLSFHVIGLSYCGVQDVNPFTNQAKWSLRLLATCLLISTSVNATWAQDDVLDSDTLNAVEEVAQEVAEAEEPAPTLTAEELEAAAVEKQNKEQEIARWAIPLISGFAINGLDPESPEENGIIVLSEGTMGLASGNLKRDGGNYEFSGANSKPENATWMDVPANKAIMLAAFKWIALSAILGWPFVAFVLRGTMYADEKNDPTSGSYFYRFVGWVCNILVLVVMAVLFLLAIRRPELWPHGPSVELKHLFPLTIALGVTTALSLLGVVVAWAKGYWRVPGRLHYTLTIISAAAFCWYLNHTGVLQYLIETNVG